MEENKTASLPPSVDDVSQEERVLENDTPSDSPAEASVTSVKQAKRTSTPWVLWILCLINLCAIIAIFAGIYWLWPQYQAEQASQGNALVTAQQQANQIKTTLSDQINAVKTQLSATQSQLNNQQRSQNNTEQQLEDFRRSLVGLDDRRPQDWLVAEAEYLVRVATRKLYLEQDVKTAIQLLDDADSQLASLQDDNLLALRAVLASDLQTLRSLPINSTSDIVLKLSGLLANSESLAFVQPKLEGALANDAESEEPTGKLAQWKSNLASSWKAIKAQFAIRQFDGQIVPQMDEQQKWWLLQRYELLLTQAQSAALQRETELYDTYLTQAIKLVSTYFAQHDAAVIGALNALKQLQTVSVEQPIPNELESLKPMQHFLEANALQRDQQIQPESQN